METTSGAGKVSRRKYGWRATYRDGLVLEERPDLEGGPRFEDVHMGRLARLALAHLATGQEVVAFDLATGAMTVRGRRLEFFLGEVRLTTRRRASHADVLQYKSAHAEWRPGAPASGTVVDGHHLGFRVSLPEVQFSVVARVCARTGRVRFAVDLVHPAGKALPPGAFYARVDGVRADTATELSEALDGWTSGPLWPDGG